jgi:DNA modification methylase
VSAPELDITSICEPSKHYNRVLLHEASDIAPALEGERLLAAKEVIDRFGQDAIETVWAVRVPESDGHYNGTIGVISGRTTLEACRLLRRRAIIRVVEGRESPVELAASLNLLRRHPLVSQRAAVGVLVADQMVEEGRKRQKTAGGDRKSLLTKLSKAIPAEEKTLTPPSPGVPGEGEKGFDRYSHAANIVDASRTYIVSVKAIRDRDPAVYQKIFRGELDLAKAKSAIRVGEKRKLLSGPLLRALPSHATPDSAIITGDALKILPTLPRRKFRLILTDPPYNQGIDYGKGSKADLMPEPQYLDWCRRWMREIPELLTPDGSAWLIISDRFAADYVNILKREMGMHHRAWCKWYETFGVYRADNFGATSRHLLYFTRSPKQFVWNGEAFSRPSDRQTKYQDPRANPAGKFWDDVWTHVPRLQGTSTERIPDFPTQLPLKLIEPIVLGMTDPGDRVLDCFSGSGTTAAACAMHDRSYTAIEIHPTFAAMSRQRLGRIEFIHKAEKTPRR